MIASDDARHYRTIRISDVRLGIPGCRAHCLLDFLRNHSSHTLSRVGHIVDGGPLRERGYRPQSNNEVVQKLLRCARKGAPVVYVQGDHDVCLRLPLERVPA